MAIVLEASRSAGRRGGRGEGERTTIREVRLIGLDRRAGPEDLRAGQRITWMGRGYQVVAAGPVPPEPACADRDHATARQYVHLTVCDEI
jgi:hypothetical protein